VPARGSNCGCWLCSLHLFHMHACLLDTPALPQTGRMLLEQFELHSCCYSWSDSALVALSLLLGWNIADGDLYQSLARQGSKWARLVSGLICTLVLLLFSGVALSIGVFSCSWLWSPYMGPFPCSWLWSNMNVCRVEGVGALRWLEVLCCYMVVGQYCYCKLAGLHLCAWLI
jgi:hypothetical protein